MAVTATDNPAVVIVSENGAPGAAGANGTDGAGFNNVRKVLLDNPLSWLYGKNNLVRVLRQLLFVSRTTSGAYTDIYGQSQVADNNTPREEVQGWLINGDEIDQFQVQYNVPLINSAFSLVLDIGSYSENSASQNIVVVPGVTGDLLKVGTDGSGAWLATIRGSDNVEYQATTVINATSSTRQSVIVTYLAGTLSIYVDSVLSGNVSLPTLQTSALDIDGNVSIAGDFDLNIQGLRFYDFVLNSEEIEYLN